LAYIS